VANFAELGLFLHRPMKTYSLGMGARLQFAVATTLQAEILIVDEVLGAGDAYFLAKSAERMRRLVDSGRTLLLVSHSIEQVMLYADRIVWIHGGRIVQDGPAAEVAAAYASFATEASESPAHGPVATSRRFLPAVPAHARAAFVRSMIARAEQGSGTDGGETWVDLPSGLKGLRRTPASGARITDVRVSAVSISDTLLQVADAVTVTIDVAADRPMEDLRVALEVYALNGTPMTLMCSPAFSMGENGGRTVSVEIAPALFGAREYLLSIAIESSAHDARECETADRLSQVVYLPFANINDADPPLMHHPAGWFFGNGVAAVPGRIKAVQ
jgi:lipopolysaccharide transport system ATP-binding protein